MTQALTSASLVILFSAAAFGQSSANSPDPSHAAGIRFEVASVKPDLNWPPASGGSGERGAGRGCPTSMKVDPARVDFKCTNLAMLIGYAFRLSPERVTGPDWMTAIGSPRFDIAAMIPRGASKDRVPEMFQTLLAERFKLIIHRGTANLPVYALVVAKGGLKVKEATTDAGAQLPDAGPDTPSLDGFYGNTQSRTIPNADGRGSTTVFGNPRMGTVQQTGDPYGVQRWEAHNISMAGLADLLDNAAPLPSPVIDMSGLKGRYQLVLEVSLRDLLDARRTSGAEPGANPMADTAETVLRGFNDGLLKLGLRLELRKGPLEILVVDHVERNPSEN